MIVADTNLVAYLLIEGEKTDIARAVWRKDSGWLVPTLWRSEFLNVLTTSVREGVLTLEQGRRTWHLALSIFGTSEIEPSGEEVLQIAVTRRLSAYDAQFVAAAIDLDVPLVTFDRRMLKECPNLAVAPERFIA